MEKDIALALRPYLYSNLKFRRAVSLRKLKSFMEAETEKLWKEETPSTSYVQVALAKLKLNWSYINTQLIRLLHEDEEAEVAQKLKSEQKKTEVSV